MEKNDKVKCSVEECTYHSGKYDCMANSIVVGNCKPTTTCCDDTLCGTFKIRKDTNS